MVCLCLCISILVYDKTFTYIFGTTEVPIIWIYNKTEDSWKLGRKAPPWTLTSGVSCWPSGGNYLTSCHFSESFWRSNKVLLLDSQNRQVLKGLRLVMVFMHVQSGYLYTKQLIFAKYTDYLWNFETLSKTLAEKPPKRQWHMVQVVGHLVAGRKAPPRFNRGQLHVCVWYLAEKNIMSYVHLIKIERLK